VKTLGDRVKLLVGFLVIGFLLLLTPFALAVTPTPERIPLTLPLLQERLNAPILSEGVATVDLQSLIIDLTSENAEFRDLFYQQLQTQINRSKQPLGLDLSGSLIQGEFIASRLGLPTPLTKAGLSQLLTPSEQAQLEQDDRFLSEAGEQISSVNVFRGPLKLKASLFTGKVDFSKTFFLQRLEALDGTFTQEGNWAEARFGRTADFSRVTFGREIDFSNSRFFGAARFRQAKFRNAVNFMSSLFWDEANFNQAEFSQFADFTRIQWLKKVDFSQVNWRDRVLFSKSHFVQSLSFSNTTFAKAVAFRGTHFYKPVEFQDVKLLEQVDFSNAVFSPNAFVNVAGLVFDSDQAKVLGDTGIIGKTISLPVLEGNEPVVRNLVRNFRRLEQIPDANQIEYKTQELRLQQLNRRILGTPKNRIFQFSWAGDTLHWMFLSLLLLLSNYGTNFGLVFGVGIVAIAYFGLLFWVIDRWRRQLPQPILPNTHDTIWILGSFTSLTLIGIVDIFQTSIQPWLTLTGLSAILLPLPLLLVYRLYQQGRYHDLMHTSYFVQDGSMRQLRLLIVRLPVIPEFPFFRDRYIPLIWERRWNWLNYYDLSFNNFIKLGFNDIRLRDEHLPGIISTLVWYQWSLGILYVALLLWTLSRTIPGLNLLIYLQ
jgi:hypothetical protein